MKKVCLSILCLAAAVVVNAQTAEADVQTRPDIEETVVYDENPHRVITNPFLSNWFVSLGGGAHMYFGDGDNQAKFGKRISGAMDIAIGKWFTPVVGARVMYTGFNAKGATSDGFAGEAIDDVYSYSKFGVNNFHADFMLNLNTAIAGYKADRIWNFIPYMGLGWAFHKTGNEFDHEPTINVGILDAFRVSKRIDINLDIHGMLVNDVFDADRGGKNWEGLLTATVGLTYRLGKTSWETPKTVYRTNHAEANELLRKLDAANAENTDLKKALSDAEAKAAAKPKEVVKPVAADDIVLFEIGSAKLSRAGKVSLGSFAGMIKDLDPETSYVITGYADAGTGSKARNEKLSKARAEAAYNCLVNEYGVNPEQLKIDHKGGVDNMFFNDPALSRAVIITIQ